MCRRRQRTGAVLLTHASSFVEETHTWHVVPRAGPSPHATPLGPAAHKRHHQDITDSLVIRGTEKKEHVHMPWPGEREGERDKGRAQVAAEQGGLQAPPAVTSNYHMLHAASVLQSDISNIRLQSGSMPIKEGW